MRQTVRQTTIAGRQREIRTARARVSAHAVTLARILVLALVFAVTPRLFAQEMFSFYDGVRALGMGGASVAVVNDETALLYNPAALGKLRDFFITVADPELEVNTDTYNVLGANVFSLENPQTALDKSKLKPGTRSHARAQIFPSLVVPNFGLGLFVRDQVDAEVDAANTAFTYIYRRDIAGVFGFNFRLFDGILKIGLNGKAIDRTEVNRTDINPASTGLTIKNLASSGVGLSSDAGLLLTIPVAALPTLGAVYRDVGGTKFNVRDGLLMTTTNKPATVPATLDAAIAIHPILGRGVRSSWTLEYSDCLDATKQEDTSKKIHGGVEFNFLDAIFLRAGWNQRYWTGGLELALGNYQFQVASYGEEIGIYPATREDRRYIGKFAIRF